MVTPWSDPSRGPEGSAEVGPCRLDGQGRGSVVASSRGRALCAAAVLACLALAGAQEGKPQDEKPWELATPAPTVGLKPERVTGSETLACAKCHAEVVAEWAGTAHAIAWVDEVYQEALDRPKPETCHGCHVPVPMLALPELGKPKARAENRDHGISCETCHLGANGAMLGATGTPTDAHATERSASLTPEGSSALCAACHSTNIGPVVGIAKDFVTSKQAERGRSCVGCHMASVERAQSESSAAHTGRSHLVQTPRDPTFLARAFELVLESRDGKAVVVIKNRAGHRVPGLIGREIRFGVFAADAAEGAKPEVELVLDARHYLPVDGSQEIVLPRAADRVRVRGLHVDPRAEAPVPFLDLELTSSPR